LHTAQTADTTAENDKIQQKPTALLHHHHHIIIRRRVEQPLLLLYVTRVCSFLLISALNFLNSNNLF
jgi:hypothetical protein